MDIQSEYSIFGKPPSRRESMLDVPGKELQAKGAILLKHFACNGFN
jgi:hypothetical protein